MYTMIIVFLRLTGKRGVRQLSIFEVAIILALGSIAGDPMFDETLPLLQAFIVMSTIIILYRLTTYLTMQYQSFEDLLEGKPLYIVEDGEMVLEHISKGKMSHDEFFAEMRQQVLNIWDKFVLDCWKAMVNSAYSFTVPKKSVMACPYFLKPKRISLQKLNHILIMPVCIAATWSCCLVQMQSASAVNIANGSKPSIPSVRLNV